MQLRHACVAAMVAVGCGKGEKPAETGRLCFAANPPEVFVWQVQAGEGAPPGERIDYLAKPTEIRFRTESIAQPGREVAIADAREGELVELVRDRKVTDSFRVSFKRLGRDLCYYFRPYKDETRRAGWILDTDREIDRCNCFPHAGSGSAGSGR